MRPPWSVILFTTLAGAGQGLFLGLYAADALGAATALFLRDGTLAALVLLAAGLVASFFHLGRPERAWRTAAMWRTSWLSREVIVLPLLMALLALYAYLQWSEVQATLLAGGLAALACLALFVCTGMIYACLPFLQEWRSPLTVVNFTLIGCATGLTAAAALAAWLEPGLERPYVGGALLVGFFAYLARLASLVRNARLRPKSTVQSAIGVQHPRVRQVAQGAMGGTYNTREFFHHQPAAVVRAVRWAFLLLLYPVPAVLLVNELEAAALGVQCLGVLAERWYFFAEAKHPQNLYYQAIS